MDEPKRHEIERAMRRAKMPRAAGHVLAALLSIRGDHDTAWPSQARIAEEAGVSDRTVRYVLRCLEASGWLQVQPGTRTTTEYRISIGGPVAVAWKHLRGGSQASRGGAEVRLPPLPPEVILPGGAEATLPGGAEVRLPTISTVDLNSRSQTHIHTPIAGERVCERARAVAPVAAPTAPPERRNLAAFIQPEIPEPEDLPEVEVTGLTGEPVWLPGTLDELLSDLTGVGHHIVQRLRSEGIGTTGELFTSMAAESLQYIRGIGPQRAQRAHNFLAERWACALPSAEDLELRSARAGLKRSAEDAAARKALESAETVGGLRVVRGGR